MLPKVGLGPPMAATQRSNHTATTERHGRGRKTRSACKKQKIKLSVHWNPDGNINSKTIDTNNDKNQTIRCDKRACSMCTHIDDNKYVVSSITNTIINLNQNRTYTCDTKWIVYVITCEACDIQYVGETSQSLRTRLTQHRRDVRENKKDTLLVKHFNVILALMFCLTYTSMNRFTVHITVNYLRLLL